MRVKKEQETPKTGYSQTTNKQAPQRTAWQNNNQDDRVILQERRESIRAKAERMNIPDIKYRTINELEMILNGYELPEVPQRVKDKIDANNDNPKTMEEWRELTNLAAAIVEKQPVTKRHDLKQTPEIQKELDNIPFEALDYVEVDDFRQTLGELNDTFYD